VPNITKVVFPVELVKEWNDGQSHRCMDSGAVDDHHDHLCWQAVEFCTEAWIKNILRR